ncbi:hypothetical protein ACFW04_010246 [Cataglyphis niger]
MISPVSNADLDTDIAPDKCVCNHNTIDYYKVLSLERNCNDTEIKEAYRRCAVRYNPTQQKNRGAEAIFALAAEAYDVLSDPFRRTVYDQYGEEGLKNGVSRPEGFVKPYVFHGEPMQTFSVADVIFVTEDRPHETFRREGSDLHMTVDIFLREALTGTVITLNTVDDRTLRIPITSIVAPDYTKRILGEGMPFLENPKQRGDLIMKFNIEFPIYLPSFSKNHIKKAFEMSSTNVENAEYIHRFILDNKMRRNIDDNIPLRRGANDEADRLKFICET